MSDPLVPIGEGHTELTDEDRAGLRLAYVATRAELFAAEQQNIAAATLRRRAPTADTLLDDVYLRSLHTAMFGQVWRWAGQYRRRDTNIGIDWHDIGPRVRNLVDDVRTWVEVGAYEPDEIGVRLYHRLVAIHPFVNGNGRHGRLTADYLVRALKQPAFTWGAGLDVDTATLRARHISALRAADAGDITELLVFARR